MLWQTLWNLLWIVWILRPLFLPLLCNLIPLDRLGACFPSKVNLHHLLLQVPVPRRLSLLHLLLPITLLPATTTSLLILLVLPISVLDFALLWVLLLSLVLSALGKQVFGPKPLLRVGSQAAPHSQDLSSSHGLHCGSCSWFGSPSQGFHFCRVLPPHPFIQRFRLHLPFLSQHC